MSKQSNRDTSHYTPSFNAAAGHTYGVNAQGNFYSTRGPSTAQGGAYHYSNRDGSYAYQNTKSVQEHTRGEANSTQSKCGLSTWLHCSL